MATGKIKWFDPRQGYGYIIPDEGGPDVFVHQSELRTRGCPADGQAVAFEIKQSPKGPIALAVRELDLRS